MNHLLALCFSILQIILPYHSAEPDAPCLGFEQIDYDNCEGLGQYVDQQGILALTTHTPRLKHVLYAKDLKHSVLCFHHSDPTRVLKEILFVWPSEQTITPKIAVYGIRETAEEVLLGTFHITNWDILYGIPFSKITVSAPHAYARYKIQVLADTPRDSPLHLLALIPTYTPDPNPDPLLALAAQISQSMRYNTGVHPATIQGSHTVCNTNTIRALIQSAPSAHCGNYAYLLISQLPEAYHAHSVGLRSTASATHNVVEIHQGAIYQTIDPTLGIVYPCSIQSLIHGNCPYQKARLLHPINPIFRPYCGRGFFYHAARLYAYTLQQLSQSYCAA